IPQGGVRSVVLRYAACVWKIVGQHSTIDVTGEGKKNFSGDFRAAGCERQTGQRNHGVTAPIAKPVITRNDRPSLRLSGQRSLHDELVGGKNQLANPGRRNRGGNGVVLHPLGIKPSFVLYLLAQDRKSTRLNSSHDQISYAVFCLKKKIKHKNQD